MAIGAQDQIDRLIVKKYAQLQVNNHGSMTSPIQAEKMMADMNTFSNMSKNMFAINQTLISACSKINSANANYRKATIAA